MQSQKDTKSRNVYKILFWCLLGLLVIDYILDSVVGGIADADELVIKQEVKGGAWVYVTLYGAPATDLDTLRFYIDNQIQGTDQEILKQLNKQSSFMITDSSVQDVVIRDTQNGVGIDVKGAVYNYYSKQYTDGEKFKSYRVSLNQQDERR
ncbi:hypothetical protein PSYAE_21944 [Pseudomonas amygdali pv. aesculi str. 0893_23]|uniref:hypothetical protein n=1 Tax=Pseudomonas syringae group genomosp. 2 TaxID=251698 RepID=UPI0001CC0D3C|nr:MULTISPECIES: hypothetical protein [Pseudomonas syringae group genomosp. 2]EGH04568.1 hypothetical protein PSYAE_21944 [Pseudomonas amygdali pv. aesculi str. 0893_23]KPW20417.1 hypothetical protein ALO90_100849 [Pseudomonas amygdali pv. aesculi]MCQ3012922.1 hypothetical protein [Pseudomonas savastanoi]